MLNTNKPSEGCSSVILLAKHRCFVTAQHPSSGLRQKGRVGKKGGGFLNCLSLGLVPGKGWFLILASSLLVLAESHSQVASSAFPRCSHLLSLAASSLLVEGSGACRGVCANLGTQCSFLPSCQTRETMNKQGKQDSRCKQCPRMCETC